MHSIQEEKMIQSYVMYFIFFHVTKPVLIMQLYVNILLNDKFILRLEDKCVNLAYQSTKGINRLCVNK